MRRVDDSFGERAVPVLTEIAGEISILTQVGEPGRVPVLTEIADEISILTQVGEPGRVPMPPVRVP